MSDDHIRFEGSIPEFYDRHLGPLLFEPYAIDLARRVARSRPARVLELASGTGIVTRRLREALPAESTIVATDLNQAMLDVAREKLVGKAGIEFRQADAMALPFEDAAFDALVCQFGIMFFPDKLVAGREALRVLRPGGLYAFNVWDTFDYNPWARITDETIASFFPSDPPTFYKVPFSYAALDPIKALLIEAGFVDIDISVVAIGTQAPSARHAATGLVYGNPSLLEIRGRGGIDPDEVVDKLEHALAAAFGDEPMKIPLQAMAITARAPGR
jgi:ubiquinone/menaquinone biosynthesis C-methylase UbiE